MNDIYFADQHNGFLFGPGLELTHDGGHTWAAATLPPVVEVAGRAGYVYALAEAPSGDDASLWRNSIGSNTWAPLSMPDTSGTFQLASEGSSLLLLQEGLQGPQRTFTQVGAIWSGKDAGSMWVRSTVPCTPADGGAAVASIATGRPDAWLVDCFDNKQSMQAQDTQHHLYGSADAGMDWVRLADPSRTGDPALMADNGSGRAFLTTESGGQDLFIATFDGARTWTTLFTTAGFSGWADLQFVNASTGFVVGPSNGYTSGNVYRTDDGGHTWRVLQFSAQ